MIDPTKPLEVVHTSDPNLSPEMNKAEYIRTRDPAFIIDGPVKKATRFVLRPLPMTARADIDDRYPSLAARQRAAFQCAIQEVRSHSKSEEVPTVQVGEYRVCTAEYYDQFQAKWGLNFVYTLGSIAYQLSGEPATNPFAESPLG